MEGTVTGEHGIGLALRDVLEEELGENATDMMRKVSWPITMWPPSDFFRLNSRWIPIVYSIVIKSFEWSRSLTKIAVAS